MNVSKERIIQFVINSNIPFLKNSTPKWSMRRNRHAQRRTQVAPSLGGGRGPGGPHQCGQSSSDGNEVTGRIFAFQRMQQHSAQHAGVALSQLVSPLSPCSPYRSSALSPPLRTTIQGYLALLKERGPPPRDRHTGVLLEDTFPKSSTSSLGSTPPSRKPSRKAPWERELSAAISWNADTSR